MYPADEKAKGLVEATSIATLEQRHQLMNAETTVDNNFELFEEQRVEEIKVNPSRDDDISAELRGSRFVCGSHVRRASTGAEISAMIRVVCSRP